MKAEGWVIEGEGPPPDAQGPGVPGGPPRKPAPPPPPRTSVPGMFSKVEYDTSHMWNQDLVQDNPQEGEKEEDVPVDFTGKKVAEKYEIFEQIGSGVTSVVRRVKPKGEPQEFVLKVVTHETNTVGGISAKNTLKNLKQCQHEHVIKLVEEFQEGDNLYLVLEKLPGTAVSVLKKSSKMWTQKNSCQIITQLLKAVVHIHSKGLTHSDLSPSNILAGDDSVNSIKIGGFSKCGSGESDGDLFCDASFKPPEVIDRKKHGQGVDLWALGCLSFLFISGKLPFKDANVMRLNQTIRKGTINFDSADWQGVDEQAKELVKGFLAVDPGARQTAEKGLENSWIKSGGSDAALPNFTKNLISTFA